jgi:choline-sulfatase
MTTVPCASRARRKRRQAALPRRDGGGSIKAALRGGNPVPDRPATRLNILFILADDLGCWGLGAYGNREIRTPHIDRLAREGLLCREFFCVSPVCSPARASILTGRIPSQHGIHDWLRGGNVDCDGQGACRQPDAAIEYLRGTRGYTEDLAAAGYICGFSGKWHLGDSARPQKGFTHWFVHAQHGAPYYRNPVMFRNGRREVVQGYASDIFAADAVSFLEQRSRDRAPFHLSLHFTAPHSPWTRDDHPADIYDSYFEECPFHSVPREPIHPLQIDSAPVGDTEERRRAILSGYFAAVTAMDRAVGRVRTCLEEHGLLDHTLIVFAGDNGMNLGHHGIYGKGNGTYPPNMFDTSIKVPMIIRGPGCAPGRSTGAMLSQYDIYPTLMDLLGLPDPGRDARPGRSFASLLRGEDGSRESDFVVVFDEYGPTRAIRTTRWKYVRRIPAGPDEMYDLVNDPGERRNLADDPACAAPAGELRARLEEWFGTFAVPSRDGARLPVTGKGQMRQVDDAGDEPCFARDWRYFAAGRKS